MSETMRIQRALARAGVASRRKAEELVAEAPIELPTALDAAPDPATDDEVPDTFVEEPLELEAEAHAHEAREPDEHDEGDADLAHEIDEREEDAAHAGADEGEPPSDEESPAIEDEETLEAGEPTWPLLARWRPELEAFRAERDAVALYP